MKPLNIYPHDTVLCRFSESIGYDMKTMHIHDVFEIYMAMCEPVKFFVNDRVYDLHTGDVMLFHQNDLHKVSVDKDLCYQRCVITFSDQKFRNLFRDGDLLLSCFTNDPSVSRKVTLSEQEQLVFLQAAKAIAAEETSVSPLSETGKWLHLGEILLLLCKIPRSSGLSFPPAEASRLPQNLFSYIDAHFAEALTLDILSAVCFLNKSYLCRIFKKETGFHIHDYIVYRRLSNAIGYLLRGESIGNTARLCGFSSDTVFIQVFRKHLGITPFQYKKIHASRK